MTYLGDFNASAVIDHKFTTIAASTGAPTALSSGAISVYKDNSTTQSTSGVTLSVDFDSVTGLNNVRIDTSSDGTFYSAGSNFQIVITTGTVGGTSVVGYVVASFSIEARNIKADVTKISGDSTAADNLETMLDGTGGQTLTLKSIVINNSAGDGVSITSSGSNGRAVALFGHGTAAALRCEGGATGPGVLIVGGGTSNNGITITTTSGHGIAIVATGSSKHGIYSLAGTNGNGLRLDGDGTGADLHLGVSTTISGSLTGSIGSLATQAKADVNAEVDAALVDINLDHLVKAAVDTNFATTVHLDSVIGQLADDGTSATFDRTTDSLESIRNRGDAAWVTGGGGSISDILNVVPMIPESIDLANTASWRIGLLLTNAVDDLPSTAEITPGTYSVDRKAIGGTSWSAVLTDQACSEAAGMVYFDEVFDSGTGYAEGDSLRITFKSQKITVSANDYEISDSTGRIFYTEIRQTAGGGSGDVTSIDGSTSAATKLKNMLTGTTGTSLTLDSVVVSNSAGDAVQLTSTGSNGDALQLTAHGTGSGLKSIGGATGPSVTLTGGGTSGNGITITTTDGHGISVVATGSSKHGIGIQGGAGGSGILSQAGSGAGHGISAVNGGSGRDFNVQLVAANFASDILPSRIQKNTAYSNFTFLMVDSADHVTPKTGLTITATRSIDGAAFASCANSASEIGNGFYKINLAAADLNGNNIALKFTATGADQRSISIVTQPTVP